MTKKRLGYSPPKERCTYNIIQSVERRENIRENKKGLEEREREREDEKENGSGRRRNRFNFRYARYIPITTTLNPYGYILRAR